VLAHLVFYPEAYMCPVRSRLHRIPWEPLEGRFREVNARAVLENHKTSARRLVHRFRSANEELRDLCQDCNPDPILIEIQRGSKPRTLSTLVLRVEAHLRNHRKELARSLTDENRSQAGGE
jgi:hypothetical protein